MKARITLMVAMMTIVLTAAAMPYTDARNKAMFLTDKMAYELNLTESQLEAVYEINLDYMLNIEEETDMFGYNWEIRNRDMAQVLSDSQNSQYLASEWFCRPIHDECRRLDDGRQRPLRQRTVPHAVAY